MELFIIHVVFISACVFFSYRSGEKNGRVQMIEDMLDRNLITTKELHKAYDIHD